MDPASDHASSAADPIRCWRNKTCWHSPRFTSFLHLVHGDLPLQRAWEIAHFLSRQREKREHGLLAEWSQSPIRQEFRQIQTVVFALRPILVSLFRAAIARVRIRRHLPSWSARMAGPLRLFTASQPSGLQQELHLAALGVYFLARFQMAGFKGMLLSNRRFPSSSTEWIKIKWRAFLQASDGNTVICTVSC